ncbi:hypothetical protein COOONC_19787, partial [Cooperia oncophora]
GGEGAASLSVAQQYVEAFQQLAKESNTVILPANLSEPSSMVAQALTLYESIGKKQTKQISDK